jgi:hypothetical protein
MSIVVIYHKDFSFQLLGPPEPNSAIWFNIHIFCCTWAVYSSLMIIGIILLRQINRFYTEKPFYLIISLYVIMVGFSYCILLISLPILLPEMFTLWVNVTMLFLHSNLVDIIPQFLFNKQVVMIQATKKLTTTTIATRSFLDELVF